MRGGTKRGARRSKRRAAKPRELTERRCLLTADDVKRPADGRRRCCERENRVSDVIDGNDVKDGVASARDHGIRSTRERAQRTVDHVERRGPARLALADDDTRTHDRDGQPLAPAPHQALRLVLGLFIRIAEPLPDVELCLPRQAAPVPRDKRGRHVCDPPQTLPAGSAIPRQIEDPAGPLDVDRPRLSQRQVKRDRSRAMDDLADLLHDPLAVGTDTETGGGQVAADRPNPPTMPLGSVAHGAQHRVQPSIRLRLGGGTHQHHDVAIGAFKQPRQYGHANEPRCAGQQDRIARARRDHARAFDAYFRTRITVPDTVPAAAPPAYRQRDRNHDTQLDQRTNPAGHAEPHAAERNVARSPLPSAGRERDDRNGGCARTDHEQRRDSGNPPQANPVNRGP